jgi:hypothetical protein
MTTAAAALDRARPEPTVRVAPQVAMAWGTQRRPQDRAPLRLLGALRGDGTLIWPGGSIAVAYELDLFGRGPARQASGNLEGDFSTLCPIQPDDALPEGVRLRLDDGVELTIELTALGADEAAFEASDPAVSALKLSSQPPGASA